jgi:FtsH-binding integral membrane protein
LTPYTPTIQEIVQHKRALAGCGAYDTQRIKEMYDVNHDGTISGRKAVMGALRLYLDVINRS